MKRTYARIVPVLLVTAATGASADAIDCFPMACASEQPPERALNLCEHEAVREVARIDAKLKPAKDLYELATNPTGFAIRMVNRHVIHIPKWVGFAMDPQGYVRGEAMSYVRRELKRQVGLEAACAAEIEAEDAERPAADESGI
jgi:hypothetical protein